MKSTCLIKGCGDKKIHARGVCVAHYGQMRRLILKKKNSWDDFIKAGMVFNLPRGKRTTRKEILFKNMARRGGLVIPE